MNVKLVLFNFITKTEADLSKFRLKIQFFQRLYSIF